MSEWRTICCPVDLTEESHAALAFAAGLAREAGGARLVVVHVLAAPGLAGRDTIFAPPPHAPREEPEGSDRRLEAWAAEAERTSGHPVTSIRVEGHVVSELLRIADEQGADLIVLGKHARTGVLRWLHRSVAETVARRAAIPVLLVPPTPRRADAGARG
jgi:universal stress protein A